MEPPRSGNQHAVSAKWSRAGTEEFFMVSGPQAASGEGTAALPTAATPQRESPIRTHVRALGGCCCCTSLLYSSLVCSTFASGLWS